MPSSILINDGRRSASPDRRVTFGNIERYDIMTSNQIKSNMNQKRDNGAPSTVNDYPMTRLDNRIRKALLLGFTPLTGDQVTYDEVLDFLLEFNVIANQRVCTERQISAIIQASFPKVITKPSAKYNVIFVNLENKSDDVIKEELVRVTTEPIIDPASMEAQAWIKEADEDKFESSDMGEEDEELTEIENKKQMAVEKEKEKAEQMVEQLQESLPIYQNGGRHAEETDIPTPTEAEETENINLSPPEPEGAERGVDVVFERSPRFKENLSQRLLSKSTGDMRSSISVRRNTSFTKNNFDRSASFNDVTKKLEMDTSDDGRHVTSDEEETADLGKATSTSNLQRKRSFTKSTNASFVGSIRDKFRSSLRKKSTEEKEKEKESKASKKDESKSAKKDGAKKKEEHNERKTTTINIKRGASKTNTSNKNNNSNEKQAVSKITSNNEIRLTVNKQPRSSTKFGGSSVDVRNKAKICNGGEQPSVSKSNSATDIRSASYRATVTKNSDMNRNEEVRGSFRTTSTRKSMTRNASDYHSNTTNNNDEKSNFVRTSGYRSTPSQNNDVRSSVRRGTTSTTDVRSSVRKSNDNKPVITKSTSLRTTNSTSVIRTSSTRSTSLTPRENNTAKRTGVRRSNSRLGATNKSNSAASSAASTPNISRENSRTNMKIPVRRQTPRRETNNKGAPKQETTQQEKDILRIAKAFQKATDEIDAAKDKVEQFMINVVIEDIESCTNNRLNVDELYDHIRHRMIVAKHKIFDGLRTDIRVDMSEYFELFFTALASHFNRVGCEITTDSSTQQRFCYLTHIKLIEYNNRDMSAAEHSDDDMQASYV